MSCERPVLVPLSQPQWDQVDLDQLTAIVNNRRERRVVISRGFRETSDVDGSRSFGSLMFDDGVEISFSFTQVRRLAQTDPMSVRLRQATPNEAAPTDE